MKTAAIFLCALCFVSYTFVRADDVAELPATCLQDAGLTLSDLPHMIHDHSDAGIRKRGCLEACYLDKLGLMTGSTINMDKVDAYIDRVLQNSDNKETVRQAVHQCATESTNPDMCMAAHNFAECAFDHMRIRIQQLLHQ